MVTKILEQDLFEQDLRMSKPIKKKMTSLLMSMPKKGFESFFPELVKHITQYITIKRRIFEIIFNGYIFHIIFSGVITPVLEINATPCSSITVLSISEN